MPGRRIIVAFLLVFAFVSGGPLGLFAASASKHDHFGFVHDSQAASERAAPSEDRAPDRGVAEPPAAAHSHHHGDASTGVPPVGVEAPVTLVSINHGVAAATGKPGVLAPGLERPPRIAV